MSAAEQLRQEQMRTCLLRQQVEDLTSERDDIADERDRLAARLAAVEALLADGPDTWEGFQSHDTGHVFVSDAVLDFTADLRVALSAAPTTPDLETP